MHGKNTDTDTDKLRAFRRCKDCYAIADRDTEYYCDEADCPIQDVIVCNNWDNGRGDIYNPEWDTPREEDSVA